MARRALGPATALVVFGIATVAAFGELWSHGPDRTLAVLTAQPSSKGGDVVRLADATFEAWLVSRNARALTTRPHRLFDAEHCAPAEQSLAFGIPMITMGALAIPSWYATGDPILTYNLTLVAMTLVAAFGMYLLVASWTGVPAAGVVAGLLFAFHSNRIADITHPSVWDMSWTLFGLWFAERLFAHGRWRDAAGLAGAIALQIGASFYPLLAATFSLPPFVLWLALRKRPALVSVAQLLFVALATLAAAAAVLGPYLGVQTDQGELSRTGFAMAPLRRYLPGHRFFPGYVVIALVAASGLLGRRRPTLRIQGDPRGPLLAGALCVALVAAGPSLGRGLPGPLAGLDLYGFFASFLPGLGAVRGVMRLSQGVHLILTLVAGLGAAELLRRAGRLTPVVALCLIGLAGLETLRAPALGLEQRYRWGYETVEPDSEAIEFFAELERQGNTGPVVELPMRLGASRIPVATRRILLSTYHGRRTSACYGSYAPAGRKQLTQLTVRLPEPGSIRALAELGFTTIVLEPRHNQERLEILRMMKLERASVKKAGLERIHADRRRIAFALRSETLPAPEPDPDAGETPL